MNIKSFWKNLDSTERIVFGAGILIILFCLLNAVSCEEKPKEQPVASATPPTVQPQPTPQPQVPDQLQVPQQPVIINQPSPSAPVHDSTMQDMLLGGLIGHAIGSSSRGAIPAPVYQQPQVVRQTVVRKVYVQPSPKSTFRSSSSFRSSSFSRRR